MSTPTNTQTNVAYLRSIVEPKKKKFKYHNVRKCSLSGCCSDTKTASLFRFPKDQIQHEIWKEKLNITPSKNSLICSKHFLLSDFIGYVNEGKRFLRLKPNAIPSVNIPGMPESVYIPSTDIGIEMIKVESNKEFLEILSNDDNIVESLQDDLDFSKFLQEALDGPTITEEENPPISEKKIYKRCCLEYCNADGNVGNQLRLHRFPLDESVLQLWLGRIKMNKNDINEHSLLCSKHFVPSDYIGVKTRNLKPITAPSKYLPDETAEKTCAISPCKTNEYPEEHNYGVSYFFFPLYAKKLDEWLQAIMQGYGVKIPKKDVLDQRICSRHFQNTEIRDSPNGKYLLDVAIPKKYVLNEAKLTKPATTEETVTSTTIQSPSATSKSSYKLTSKQENTPLGKAIKRTLFELKMQKLKITRLEYQNSLLRLERAHGPADAIVKPAVKEVTRKLSINDLDRFYCRLCLTTDVKTTTFSAFGVINNEMISDLVKKLFDIQIEEFDAVTDVCESCLAKIDVSKSIRTQFNEANKILERIMSNEDVDITETVPVRVPSCNVKLFTKGTQTNSVISEGPSHLSESQSYDESELYDNENYEMDISIDTESSDDEIEEHEFFKNYDSLVYCCSVCPMQFSTSHGLQHHLGTHQTDECLQCIKCGLLFKNQSYMNTHEKRVHSDEKFACDICDKTYSSTYTLQVHRAKHNEQGLKCVNCPEKFNSRTDLHSHIEQSHADMVQYCDCGKSFHNPCTFARHVCQVTEDWSENVCQVCQMKFLKHTKLIKHVEKEHSDVMVTLPYTQCSRCSKTFLSQKRRYRHQVICNGYGGVLKE